MMNWLGRLLQLPEEFLNIPGKPGGGIIQVLNRILSLGTTFEVLRARLESGFSYGSLACE